MLEGGGKARAGGDFQVVNVGLLMDDRVRSPRRKPVAGAPACQSPCSQSRPILVSSMIAVEGEAECLKSLFVRLLLAKTSRNAVRRSMVKNIVRIWYKLRTANSSRSTWPTQTPR